MTSNSIHILSAQDRSHFEKRYGADIPADNPTAYLKEFIIDNVSTTLAVDQDISLTENDTGLYLYCWVRLSSGDEINFSVYPPADLSKALSSEARDKSINPHPEQWFILFDNGQSFVAPDLANLQSALPTARGLPINNADPFENILLSAAQRVMAEEGFGGIILSSLLERIKTRAEATSGPMDDDMILWVLQNDDQLAYIRQDPPGYFPYGPDDADEDFWPCPSCGR